MAHIKTYARIKPTGKPSKRLDHESTNVAISVPQLQPSGQTRDCTATLTHQFEFAGVFGPTSTQDEVFDSVASHIVDGFLSGYNGTIFAYGQTGSGKTFTIEGGAKSYSDRGLAPRALSRIYKSLENQKFDELSIKVSYLEIYQEIGYDLLNPTTRPGNVVTHLPKVSVTDGPNNSCIVRNLSMHLAADERVAQSLLLQGQASRKVAETPMNQRSSRSHAVFTIYVKTRQKGSHAVNMSKLHLVDLAGSERVAKTKIAGQQLHEAKSINLSLHHLEGVIIALQGGHGEGSRVKGRRRALSAGPVRNRRVGSASSTRSLPYHRSMSVGGHRHVPYRNSLLTMVLRDSLGGNCLTAMIATISAEEINLSESLSTCRFAMRVAAIQNKISRNEVIDDKTIIARLRKKIANLEEEILALKRKISEDHHRKIEASSESTNTNNHPAESTTHTSSSSMKGPSSLADAPKPLVAPANGSGLTREGRQHCARIMQGFVSGRVTDPVSSGVSDFSSFRECLRILREMIHRSYAYHQRYNPALLTDQQQGSKVRGSEQDTPDVKRSPEGVKVKSRSSNEKGQSKSYKSPFERKREKEISKLTKNVETQIAEQKQQRKDLMEFKTLLKQQQLENALRDLSNKISMTTDHLEKQQELVENLRQCKASREQITAEKIAQKQLAKRLAKYEKRYQLALEHLQIVCNHIELQDRVSKARQSTNHNTSTSQDILSQSDSSSHPSSQTEPAFRLGLMSSPRRGTHQSGQSEVMLDRIGVEDDQSGSLTDRVVERCRHKSGRVDSKRVLDILKQEDSKRNKAAKEIKEQRIKNFTQHFALKEEATLTKLQHFKEQLRKQQESEQWRSNSSLSMSQSWDGHVNTAWSDDVSMERSRTSQSAADPAFNMRQPCGDHVDTAWSDDVTIEMPGIDQSGAFDSAINDSESANDVGKNVINERHEKNQPARSPENFVNEDSQKQNIPLQPSSSFQKIVSKENLPDISSKKDNKIAAEPAHVDTVVQNLHAFNVPQERSPHKTSLEDPSAKTIALTRDSLYHGGDTTSVQVSDVTTGSSASVQSLLSPHNSMLHSSPLGKDTESSSFGEGTIHVGQESKMSSVLLGRSSTRGRSVGDGPALSHSADSIVHEPRGLPKQSPDRTLTNPRSSFDAALSSMLRQDKSTVSPPVLEDTILKAQHSGDVTLALKTKLLDYLGGKPMRGPSVSSVASLQNGCSRSSINRGFTGSSMQRDAFGSSTSNSLTTGSSIGTVTREPSLDSFFAESSINSGFTGSSLQSDVFGRSSSNSLATGSFVGTVTREPSFAESSIHGAFDRSSWNSAHESSSPNRSFDRSSVHSGQTGSSIDRNIVTSSKPPTFQIGASRSTLNSIGEEESINPRGGEEAKQAFLQSNLSISSLGNQVGFNNERPAVKAMAEAEGQRSYISAAKENKERIQKIRKAIRSAEVIQRAWKKYCAQRK
ncbi:kinesin-related protein 5-like [Lytechinus variegatus]|uniref:kinesin-related protein 5-like n=1 Tax=Lytechinus variegatus TaxID=7654 RepID=UPI001BB1468F|nr:kinesin-related protein 5-like [Lytechinus variegatus]